MREGRKRGEYLKMELGRAFCGRFILSVLLVTLVFFLDTEVSARQIMIGMYPPQPHENVLYYLEQVLYYGVNHKMFLLVMTIGYAARFPEDWKSGMIPEVVGKLGVKRYAGIRIGLSGLTGGLAVVSGFGGYLFWMNRQLPMMSEDLSAIQWLKGLPYFPSLTQQEVQIYLFSLGFLLFLSGAMWSALAAGLSVIVNNTYLVMIFPYLLSRCYIEFAKAAAIPNAWRVDRWFTAMVQPFSIPVCLGIAVGFCMILWLGSGYIFAKSLRWRMENGWI